MLNKSKSNLTLFVRLVAEILTCQLLFSASAPTVAAIIANLNSIRMSRGQKPLGFLNPWIYGRGLAGWTDITAGGSGGCYNISLSSGLPAPEVIGAGFNATKGWDAVTGQSQVPSNGVRYKNTDIHRTWNTSVRPIENADGLGHRFGC